GGAWTTEESCGRRKKVWTASCGQRDDLRRFPTLGSNAALKEAPDAEAGRRDEGLDNSMRRVRHGGRGHCGRLEGVPGRRLRRRTDRSSCLLPRLRRSRVRRRLLILAQ